MIGNVEAIVAGSGQGGVPEIALAQRGRPVVFFEQRAFGAGHARRACRARSLTLRGDVSVDFTFVRLMPAALPIVSPS